jgi:hypothetical protein
MMAQIDQLSVCLAAMQRDTSKSFYRHENVDVIFKSMQNMESRAYIFEGGRARGPALLL